MRNKIFILILSILLLCGLFTAIDPNLIAHTQIEEQLKASIYTDKQNYQQNENVTIFGQVTFLNGSAVKGASVSLEVKNPRNSTIFLDIEYTQNGGIYQSSFRLSQNDIPGLYTIYLSAFKPGCLTVQNKTTFWVSAFTIEIKGCDVSVTGDNRVEATINITLQSGTLLSLTIGVHFMLISPSGKLVYDRQEKPTIYNNTITNITLAFTLPTTEPGYYSYGFFITDEKFEELFRTTGWQIAFLYMPPSIATFSLHLSSNSSDYAIVDKSLNRFESIECTINLTEPTSWLMVFLECSTTSGVIAAINKTMISQQNSLAQTILESTIPVLIPPPLNSLISLVLQRVFPTWVLFNVPSGLYTLAISTTAEMFVRSVCVIAGPKITSSSVKILDIIPSSNMAFSGGIINYNVYVSWNITESDKLKIIAKLNDNVLDEKVLDVEILEVNAANMYLSIAAPENVGEHTINFEAKLEKAQVFDQAIKTLNVVPQKYNITFAGKIAFWRTPTLWSHIFFGEQYEWVENQDKLSALLITDLKVIGVTEWSDEGKPKTVEISFNATNKISGKIAENLKFGEGVHYEVAVKPSGSFSAVVKILIAGDSEVIKTTIPVNDNGQLCFDIIYSQWMIGGFIEIAAAVIKPAIAIITSGVGGIIATLVTDVAKLTLLYVGKFIIDYKNGFFTHDSIRSFLLDIGLSLPETALEILDELELSCRNPFFALYSFILNSFHEGKIDLIKYLYATFRLGVALIMKVLPNLKEILIKVLEDFISKKFKFSLTEDIISKLNNFDFEALDKAISAVLSLGESIMTIWRYFTSPSEEGKRITNTQIGLGPRVEVDPHVSIFFSGSSTNLNLTWINDVYDLQVNINKTRAAVQFTVDPSVTSVYLAILSDESYSRKLLNGMGFNATEIEFRWQKESNIFNLIGIGSIHPYLQEMNININKTYINGFQKMSLYPIQKGRTLWLNFSLNYPFHKNLNYEIVVELPQYSKILDMYSDADYTIQTPSLVVWNSTPNWISIHFTPYGNDTTPPTVTNITQTPEDEISPYQPVKIYVNATDDLSGIKNVTLDYKINDTDVWIEITMTLNETMNLYEATIPGQPPNSIVAYKIIVYDYAENKYIADNAGTFYVFTVIPEFPSTLPMKIFMLATLTAIIIRKTKRKRQTPYFSF
jgi:hypothetical protein